MKIIKISCVILTLFFYSIMFVTCEQLSTELYKKHLKNFLKKYKNLHANKNENTPKVNTPNKNDNNKDIPDRAVYFEGWIKYLHFQQKENNTKPKAFFKNDYHGIEKNTDKKDEVFIILYY